MNLNRRSVIKGLLSLFGAAAPSTVAALASAPAKPDQPATIPVGRTEAFPEDMPTTVDIGYIRPIRPGEPVTAARLNELIDAVNAIKRSRTGHFS